MTDTLMVGVSGVRGIVGKDLTDEIVGRYARAFGLWATGRKPLVVVGRDARESGPAFERAVVDGLRSVGCAVVKVGLVPTPTVQLAVEHHQAGGGIVITASHNPIEWNALKFIGPDGIFLDGPDGARVQQLAVETTVTGRERTVKGRGRGKGEAQEIRSDPRAVERHLDAVLELPAVDVDRIRRRQFKVALDAVRGAGGPVMRVLLERLGCSVTGINLETDGQFPRAPEPVPENLGELSALVRRSGADLGIAVDPDVDRLAMVDETGAAIGEDYTLAFDVRAVLGVGGRGEDATNCRVQLVHESGGGGCGACARRRDRAHARRRGPRRPRHLTPCGCDRGGRERRSDVSRAARRPRRARSHGAGFGAARADAADRERAGEGGAALYHCEGENAPRPGARAGVHGAAAALRRRPGGHSGWAAARLARPLAPCAAVQHRADRPADRRSADERSGSATGRRGTASMCGIVGYTGPRQAAALLLEGLRRLEYRGYDSAGLALVDDGRIEVHKAPGKISVLEQELGTTLPPGHTGIAHTRWATHGAPNAANAHPHTDCGGTLALIHNGIIENAHVL